MRSDDSLRGVNDPDILNVPRLHLLPHLRHWARNAASSIRWLHLCDGVPASGQNAILHGLPNGKRRSCAVAGHSLVHGRE